MRMPRVEDLRPEDRARVGGKAWGLHRLFAAGAPVPAAVVLPVELFQAFLLDRGWSHRAQAADPSLGAELRASRFPSRLSASVQRAVRDLGPLLAVRSSAADEDGGESSFAGQYESVIGVTAGEPLERAILQVWASAFSATARAYRASAALPEMAVLVQTLVDPRCAGVLFTINPHSGSWREMTVEAAWGLGEAVVGGRIQPDFYKVSRPRRAPGPLQRVLARVRLRVAEVSVARQETAAHPAPIGSPGGGQVERAVPAARRVSRKLNEADLLALCRLGLKVESALGGPQDIEWAQDEAGRFTLLQARPVTTARDVRPTGRVIWTRRFIGERWTEPATPLGWSEIRALLEPFIAYPITSRRLLGGEEPARLFRFAPYFNVTVFRHLAFKAPGAAPPRFMVELLPPVEESSWMRRRAELPDLAVYRSILSETFAEARWRRFRWNPLTNWRAWEEFERGLGPALGPLSTPLHSVAEARARIQGCRDLAGRYVGVHICSLLFANIGYEAASALLVAEGHEALIPTLLVAPASTSTARTNAALGRLGRGELDWDSFSAEFGHRATSSWELFSPRWSEEPARAWALARAAASAPPLTEGDHGEAALDALGPLARRVVRLTRRYLQLREDQRAHFDRILWRWKEAWLHLEAAAGLRLRFLELREAEALLDDDLSRGRALELIERREAAHQEEEARRQRGDEPPDFLVGDEAVAEAPHEAGLTGMGVSAGVVTGTVRVIRSPSEAASLKPGEILVTRATDPGWTPLFLVAGGLVMELGGMLSHGAVVAREYGRPAVVNVSGATRLLSDGQTVTVDGGRGRVWIR
jgi:phosphohistidine swiveling domain-containing protein